MLIEIFKTGTHTDSAGNTRAWTEKDLDAIASKYDPANHEAPVVIGHPKDNAPAYGWVERLERKGSVLYAKLKDLVPEFVEAVKRGLYKKRSISLYPDLTLRHVGFLGAMPPAVKGLADVQFSEAEAVTIEFADYRMSTISRIFQRLRDLLIEKFGADVADKVVNSFELEDLQREPAEPETASAFNENTNKGGHEDMGKIEELEAKLKEAEGKIASFAEKEDEIARLKRELDEERAKQRKAEFNSFCEGLTKEGRLTPAMKPSVLDFMEIMSGAGEYEFSEGDDKKVKAQPVEKFKAFLSALPKQVEFSEMATKDKVGKGNVSHDFSGKLDEERLELHKKAIEFMEKEDISYKDALNKALKEG